MNSVSNKITEERKFVEQTIFYRILLLAATIAYLLSASADTFMNLGFKTFILPSAVISFLLFSVFVLSFFIDTITAHFNLLTKIIASGILVHLIGLSVLNHFRPEHLIALLAASFTASFVFRRIKILILFDIGVCAILLCGIYIDQYFTNQFLLLKVHVAHPYIDPLFFMLSTVGVMILASLFSTVRAVQFNLGEKHSDSDLSNENNEAHLLINIFTGKIIDCNEAALLLFQASSKSELVNNNLDSLLKEKISSDILKSFREQLNSKNKVATIANFVSQKGVSFNGVIIATKSSNEEEFLLNAQITEVPIFSDDENKKESLAEKEDAISEGKPTDEFSLSNSTLAIASIGLDYRFVRVSEAFCELTGYSQYELQNIKLLDIIYHADKETEKKILSNLFSGAVPSIKKEKRILRKNNTVIWVTSSSSLVRDENGYPQFVMSVMENINKQKREERSLLKDKISLSSVLDNSDMLALNVDRNHAIAYVNEPLKDILFGLTDIVVERGFNLKQIIPSVYQNRYIELFERGMKGEDFSTDERIEIIGGSKVDIEVSVRPVFDEDKNIISLTISGKDITERKEKERELIKARDEAEAATEAKAGFLATMSHEIRTPLTGVIGMGKLLNQTELSPKQQDYVHSILLSGEALLSVINDILDFSKMESAKMELESHPILLKQSIADAFELMSSKAVEKNLSLEFSIQKNVPRYIIGDMARLRQILLNLISNGIKFTVKGKISVHIAVLRQEGEHLQLLFEVRDTGIGIPTEKRDKLFKSFSQIDSSTAKTYGGSGLGLAISKNLVTLMGGKIWVESESGKGSSFFFTIDSKPVLKEEIPQGKTGASKLSRATVLIISEDKSEEKIYADYFQRWGVKVKSTSESKIAIEWIKSGEYFNLIALDAQLISTSSMIVASQIRNIIPKEELPIILFNVIDNDITYEFTDKIISALIPKDIDRSKLLDVLIEVFSMEEHQQTRQEKALSRGIGKQLAIEIPLRILVAEDNAINQKLAQNMFEGLGYRPDMVSNGVEVIEKLRVKEYDMLFMDVQMPELGGLETTKYILEKLNLAKRPVIIAMTAFALEGDREKCIEAGMNDYISKPFLIEEIVHKIKQWGQKTIQTVAMEEPEKPQQEILNISVINKLRNIGNGNGDEFIMEVISMFILQAERIIENINIYCGEKRYEEMGQAAHKLKGSALNVGAEALAKICKQLELKARIGDGGDCEKMMDKLNDINSKTTIELKKIS